MDGKNSSSDNNNPWPYLNSFFEFKSRNGNSLKFVCLLCKPKATEISAYATSPSNLGKHIKVIHGSKQYEKYQSRTLLVRKRKQVTDDSNDDNKQRKLTPTGFTRRTSQSIFDKHLISLVTQGLLPFQLVELPAFKQLVDALQPGVQIMSRATLKRRIDIIADATKKNVATALSKVEYVATTTDCWSARRRSFIGLTAHWIDYSSLERCTAALACRRLKGSHTYDVLACAIDDIHSAYDIRDKVVRTTTDNGSNFLKAFSIFSVYDDGNSENIQNESGEEETDARFTDACEILASGPSLEYKLPTHQRCACHILHLVATKDSLQAETNDDKFKKLSRATFAKLASVWNKVGRSTTAAETVENECGLQFIRPNQTRWNSLYLAVERIVLILKGRGETALRNVFNSFEVRMLTAVEQDFVKEYCAVMKPVAKAIDILQSEKNAYMGWLLPTLEELLMKLERAEDSARFCKPLASAIMKGIQTRFAAMMEDPQLISAAILLPKFKTEWTSNKAIIEKGLEHLRRKMAETMTTPQESTSEEDDEEDFFSSMKNRSRSSSSKPSELETYLSAGSRDLALLHSMPAIKKLFMLLNTPLPASAACERLFSSAGLIFTPKRANIGSKNFENQLLLKLNHKYCG